MLSQVSPVILFQRMLFRKMLDLRLKCHRFCLGSVRPVYDLILVPHVINLKPVSLATTACLATEVPDVSLKSRGTENLYRASA